MVLFRLVDIGAELFAMSAACSRAQMLAARGQREAVELADVFCRESRLRVRALFRDVYGPADGALYALATRVLRGEHAWLEEGICRWDAGAAREDADAALDAPTTAAAVGD